MTNLDDLHKGLVVVSVLVGLTTSAVVLWNQRGKAAEAEAQRAIAKREQAEEDRRMRELQAIRADLAELAASVDKDLADVRSHILDRAVLEEKLIGIRAKLDAEGKKLSDALSRMNGIPATTAELYVKPLAAQTTKDIDALWRDINKLREIVYELKGQKS